ncbi:transcriptional regulator [Xanthobacter sp. TB0136]|uniref:transcriptional regulator n=1 Tax=Xanthobacter sp. TB0136 TaxID=3459177 RepID=UPI0040392A7D
MPTKQFQFGGLEVLCQLGKVAFRDLGLAGLARQLNVRRQAVYQWRAVPPSRVLEVERITGVSRHDLRPDLFGPVPDMSSLAQPDAPGKVQISENCA